MLIAFYLILVHWFADFVLQTHWQAINKSKNNKALLMHTGVYSTVWFLLMNTMIILNYLPVSFYLFAPITFVFHTITDYFTSRLNTKLWNKGDIHNFFVSVGFDQVLHYAQLFLTYYLLIK